MNEGFNTYNVVERIVKSDASVSVLVDEFDPSDVLDELSPP